MAGLNRTRLAGYLIDEAGQALPQAAVGAVMRCKRAVVVGDPLQIEPVVVLPDQLTEAICREFRIDETRFNAPAASAQTLADAATPCFSSFETKTGSREVGVPLLVHRRCADPMFSISNSIAYENLMVQAKAPKQSRIMDVLGPSASYIRLTTPNPLPAWEVCLPHFEGVAAVLRRVLHRLGFFGMLFAHSRIFCVLYASD